MKTDEAIELLESLFQGWPVTNLKAYDKALRMGIKALKIQKAIAECFPHIKRDILRGEKND